MTNNFYTTFQMRLAKKAPCYSFILLLTLFCSCKNKTYKATNFNQSSEAGIPQKPNYNYTIKSPRGWAMYDTVMEGLKVRLLKAPASLGKDNPLVNVIIASMKNSDIDDFTWQNMDYLKKNMENIILLEKGHMYLPGINARWFTYTKEQDGITREMINYIIPVGGFAYMITCGVNAGKLSKYRQVFDEIANSFKG